MTCYYSFWMNIYFTGLEPATWWDIKKKSCRIQGILEILVVRISFHPLYAAAKMVNQSKRADHAN